MERHELLREQNQVVIHEAIAADLLNPEHGDTINSGELIRSIERDSMVWVPAFGCDFNSHSG